MPLVFDQVVDGLLLLEWRKRARHSEDRQELAEVLARQVGLFLQLVHLAHGERLAAVAEERNRMAGEIHDSLAQGFTGVVVQLNAADEMLDQNPAQARKHVDLARELARVSLNEARRSVLALRPQALESAGLAAALRRICRQLATSSEVEVEVAGQEQVLPNEVEHGLMRIGQEALTNAVRHARASRIVLRLGYGPQSIRLEVEDDGEGGIEAGAKPGVGLALMRERAARMGGRLMISKPFGKRYVPFGRNSVEVGTMESQARIRLLLADDHTVVRDGFAAIIGYQPDMEVVASVADGREAVESYRALRPDVALLDLRMPVLGGVRAIEEIRREFPSARIIVLTTYDGDEDVYRALQAGAAGYLLKDTTTEALLRAIRSVAAGQRYVPPEIAARLVERTMAGPGLTAREVEVLGALATGKTNKEIAAEFFITEGTVKSHVNNILDKLGVRDRTEAVMEALRRGILHL